MFESMDAPPRGALMLVRFAAAALISMSLLEFGLYLAECHNIMRRWGWFTASCSGSFRAGGRRFDPGPGRREMGCQQT